MSTSSSLGGGGQGIKSSGSEQSKPVSPRERFRRLARSVQSQSRWTKALQSKIADEHSKDFQINQESGGSHVILSFNANGKRTVLFFRSLYFSYDKNVNGFLTTTYLEHSRRKHLGRKHILTAT